MNAFPRLLDLFCGAGGAAHGYQQAGFYVVGVDLIKQSRYAGDVFYLGDAMDVLLPGGRVGPYCLRDFDAVHASPPCQHYSTTGSIFGREQYPDLVGSVRELLKRQNRPWVIENVPGAPLAEQPTLDGYHGITLCGTMFGLELYRHRLFESNVPLPQPSHPFHAAETVAMGRPPVEGKFLTVVGHFTGVEEAQRVMGCPWMTQSELAQAIPPAYTEFIGDQLISALERIA